MPSQPPSPHIGVIMNPSARRMACDQCHAQKLRCTKLEASNVCVRCQRLNRRCIWSPPSRSGRPATTTGEDKLVGRSSRGDSAGERRRNHKRPLSVLELTPEEDSRPGSARAHSTSVSPRVPNDQSQPESAMGGVEIPGVPPSLPPAITEWNMSDLFSLPSPHGSLREVPSPSLRTPDSGFQMPSLTDYFQLPFNGFGGLEDPTRTIKDGSAHDSTPAMAPTNTAPGLGSLQSITQELSAINLSLFNLEQSLHAEPWGPMFASPATVLSKLSSCRGDQPDTTLAQGYPLTEIFNKTQRFIEIARQAIVYFAPSPTPLPSLSTLSSTSHPPSTGQGSKWPPPRAFYPESDTSSQASSRFSPPPLDMYMQREMPSLHSSSSPSTIRGDQLGSSTSCDLPTALLFTTGYARILDLYTTVLTQISHFVRALSEQSIAGGPDYRQRMHPVIPPLQWGGFQPAHFGALQILMTIQVISYLLTDVERVLGVDEWEREMAQDRPRSRERGSYFFPQMHPQTRRREPGPGEGGRSRAGRELISAGMIQLVLQGEEPGNRWGRLKMLRRKLRRVKKELESGMHI